MAVRPKPATISVVRRGKTFEYSLADEKDWALMFNETVLEIRSADKATYYWPLDSVTLWVVK